MFIFYHQLFCILYNYNIIHSIGYIHYFMSTWNKSNRSCDIVAPVEQCSFFSKLSFLNDYDMNYTPCNVNDSLVFGNIYIQFHSSLTQYISGAVPYQIFLFESLLNNSSDVYFVPGSGMVITESNIKGFLVKLGYADSLFCLLNDLILNNVLFQVPRSCNGIVKQTKYVLLSYSRDNWIDTSLFCL